MIKPENIKEIKESKGRAAGYIVKCEQCGRTFTMYRLYPRSSPFCYSCKTKNYNIRQREAKIQKRKEEQEAAYKLGRTNGIDELCYAIASKFTEYEQKGYNTHTNAGIKIKVFEIAEQMKEGENT